jgi:MFS family permease
MRLRHRREDPPAGALAHPAGGEPVPARPAVNRRPLSGRRSRRRGVFLSGQAVSLLGDGLAVLAIPLLVLDLSRSPLILGLSAASVTAGYLAVGLPAGVLVDRMDPWRVLMLMDAARAVLFACLFACATSGLMTVWLVLLIAFGAGACAVFFQDRAGGRRQGPVRGR